MPILDEIAVIADLAPEIDAEVHLAVAHAAVREAERARSDLLPIVEAPPSQEVGLLLKNRITKNN